jgi:tRNA-dihydrouridine synthase
MMSPSASALCHMFHGPFWSRERAEEFLENTNYRYGNKASVFCKSLYHYPEMRRLFDASKNLSTPSTSSALAEVADGIIANHQELNAELEQRLDTEVREWTQKYVNEKSRAEQLGKSLDEANAAGQGWMERANAAEQRLQQPAPPVSFYRDGIMAAAKWVDQGAIFRPLRLLAESGY